MYSLVIILKNKIRLDISIGNQHDKILYFFLHYLEFWTIFFSMLPLGYGVAKVEEIR